MLKTELIKGSDVVLLSSNTPNGLVDRAKEYGFLGAFMPNMSIKLGIVCVYNGAKVVVTFGSKPAVVPLYSCHNSVKEVYRSNNYTNSFAALDMQDSCMAMFANQDQYKLLKKESISNIGGVILYILTSSRVRYPIDYSRFDFKLHDILSKDNGFNRII